MRVTPKEAMTMAIAEGKKGAGFVSPNPLVGCVILDANSSLLATGFHARVGEGHAEVQALNAVHDKSKLAGAHIYVTLEPCAHEGRTPSCAKTLAALPIASVTYGLEDPNPKVSGQGAEILRNAGKKVDRFHGLEIEIEELCEIFLVNMRHARPFVAIKAATSLDGKIALRDGSSQWITTEKSRENVQMLRGHYDAILSGVGSFIKDNPRFNSRDPRFSAKPQKVVLLDPEGTSLPLLKGSALLDVRPPENVFVVVSKMHDCDLPVQQLIAPVINGEFDLAAVLDLLFKRGIFSIFIEGGAFTYSSFLTQKMADRLYLYLAPKILGEGINWTAGLKIASLDSALRLKHLRIENFGEDLLLTGLLDPISQNENM